MTEYGIQFNIIFSYGPKNEGQPEKKNIVGVSAVIIAQTQKERKSASVDKVSKAQTRKIWGLPLPSEGVKNIRLVGISKYSLYGWDRLQRTSG